MTGKDFESSYAELHELVTRVLCDTAAPTRIADAAYLFGEDANNESSVFGATLLAWKLGRVKRIAVCGYIGGHGYPGFANWRVKLIKLGVPVEKIIDIPVAPDFPPSTHAESFGLVRYAKKNKWGTVYVVAPPMHQLRAFVTTVTAIRREKSHLSIYNFVGLPQKWKEHIIHSQGTQKGTRSKLLAEELKKIEAYYKKGDLVSGKMVLEYLDTRDTR